MQEIQQFHVTFGSMYATEPHPVLANAHPDGYYLVEARSMEAARHLVYAVLGTAWSHIYTPEGWEQDSHLYPLGQIGKISSLEAILEGTEEVPDWDVRKAELREKLRAEILAEIRDEEARLHALPVVAHEFGSAEPIHFEGTELERERAHVEREQARAKAEADVMAEADRREGL